MDLPRYRLAITPKQIADQIKGAAFKRAFAKIPNDLLRKETSQLEEMFTPTYVDKLIRDRLWFEVFQTLINQKKIDSSKFYEGVCSYTHWYNNILNQPTRLAWLLSSNGNFPELIEMYRHCALEKAREILEIKKFDSKRHRNQVLLGKVEIFKALSEAIDYFPRYK